MNINCKGPQTDIPQIVGSKEDLISKNIPSRHIEYIKMFLDPLPPPPPPPPPFPYRA